MHPALSVIFFTTASGAGYGLLALLGAASALGLLPGDPWFGPVALVVALGWISAGLLSSTAHLGRPERAWRAFSQWRTSWLSREGVAAIVTYVPALLFGALWLFVGPMDRTTTISGLTAAAMAAVTVFCTAMIYASLKPIHQWRNAWVPCAYLTLSLASGALWLDALLRLWGTSRPVLDVVAIAALVLGAWIKSMYWRFIDTTSGASTPESATGLGGHGKVAFLEAPHTEENYLLREMGYSIARKHAAKLRRISFGLGFGLPATLTVLALIAGGGFGAVLALLAALLCMAGILVERWLFFAEARHTVTLYYGAGTV